MSQQIWYLEEVVSGNTASSVAVTEDSLIIGRHVDCDIRLKSDDVSRRHAELFFINNVLYVRDLDSVNGTYVNRKQVDYTRSLEHMDVLHIVNHEFKIVRKNAGNLQENTQVSSNDATVIRTSPPGKMATSYANYMHELLELESLNVVYQPIVSARNLRTVAAEAFGYGTHPALPSAMQPLFFIAENINKTVALSELIRNVAGSNYSQTSDVQTLFLKLHPQETNVDRILRSFQIIQIRNSATQFVLQVQEKSINDMGFLAELKNGLSQLDIKLAYEEFGEGHARLLEITKQPPDYIKFSANLVGNLHEQPQESQYVVQALVDVAKKLGIKTIANGLDSKESASLCREIGFDLFQGSDGIY